ncbi:ShlB/FhaC/HecB family hemolysin secretion/activation protein [Marinobacter xestospongiae]|uniref:ShlB/FhaC/HecB family hemolysin secretion/activation protein n=1 Tax=Marinobacter xestospongiae TaxID=994319 RepID=A0ABU3W220_9GAMM|nr:ShlB/FhaC/HecB family hemolysin secretion/activation protein [Marinobacter xestospongiae]MDV2080580.1 ShlB/FhaC/HecB family hemolysin secretion/activation protein [Marinobacter xestospongiae]
MQRSNNQTLTLTLVLAAPLMAPLAQAQTAPDAGQILQQNQPDTLSPTAPSVDLELQGEALTDTDPGGRTVILTAITFQGNQRFSDNELARVIPSALGHPRDLAGLRCLANNISRFYRDQGYPFTHALLPAQSLNDGALTIQVVEGRYGQVTAHSDDPQLVTAAQPYLTPLASGEAIASAPLERQMLLLGDLPGLAVTPVLRPGQAVGEGDLDVRVQKSDRVAFEVGADNHGNRFSGAYRGHVGATARGLLTVGDELRVTALYSSEQTWLGNLDYSRPIGSSGLRADLGYAHTDYSLGKGFDGYTGTAHVYTTGLSYPLMRRQTQNLSLSARYRYKDLDDTIDFADYRKATESHSLPLVLRFDSRDALGQGGLTYGSLGLTPGVLDQSLSGQTGADYGFTKINLDLARLQTLGYGVQAYGRVSGQWADRKHLDGSESFQLGGPNGVRAYPNGEGSDSRGWLAQLELRYHTGFGLAPYLFYDQGRTPNGGADEGDARSLAGAGLGLRYRRHSLNLDLSSAWPLDGGDAQSDDRQRDPRLWASLGYQF